MNYQNYRAKMRNRYLRELEKARGKEGTRPARAHTYMCLCKYTCMNKEDIPLEESFDIRHASCTRACGLEFHVRTKYRT